MVSTRHPQTFISRYMSTIIIKKYEINYNFVKIRYTLVFLKIYKNVVLTMFQSLHIYINDKN